MNEKVLKYLDCGCAIMDSGRRSICPTCSANPKPSSASDQVRSVMGEVFKYTGQRSECVFIPESMRAAIVDEANRSYAIYPAPTGLTDENVVATFLGAFRVVFVKWVPCPVAIPKAW